MIIRNINEVKKVQYVNGNKESVYINDDITTVYPIINDVVKNWIKLKKKIHSEPQPTIEEVRAKKLQELNDYYNSEEIKRTVIPLGNIKYTLINTSKIRNLILRKITVLQGKISAGLITKDQAVFPFRISSQKTIDIPLLELQKIGLYLEERRQLQFDNKSNHKFKIQALKSKASITKYNFKTGW